MSSTQERRKDVVSQLIASAIVFVIFATFMYFKYGHNNPPTTDNATGATSQTTNLTLAPSVIDNKEQNYTPANASYFTTAQETAFANLCLSANGMQDYPSSTQVSYCGCYLAQIEQNTTPAEIHEYANSGNMAYIAQENQSALNKNCSQFL